MVTLVQTIVALGIYNVWILRFNKETAYRGGNAKNLPEEFAVYGLSKSAMLTIGAAKLLCATGLMLGVFFPELTKPAAMSLGLLMAGAVCMHIKVKDPISKALPALGMLIMCLTIAAMG